MGAELRRYHSWNGYLCFLFRQPRGPEQALAKGRCQDADCERLIGVNVYGSGARLVSIDLAAYNCLAADSGSARPLIESRTTVSPVAVGRSLHQLSRSRSLHRRTLMRSP
jgi:hypothetical protein